MRIQEIPIPSVYAIQHCLDDHFRDGLEAEVAEIYHNWRNGLNSNLAPTDFMGIVAKTAVNTVKELGINPETVSDEMMKVMITVSVLGFYAGYLTGVEERGEADV